MYFCRKDLAMIRFFSNEIDFKIASPSKVKQWILNVINNYGYKAGNLNVIFCSDDYLLQINKEFLQHDYYTDIITFDYTEGDILSGELYISIHSVLANAQEYNQPQARELMRVVIHGFLHLMGFDDHTEEEQQIMHAKEDQALELFDFNSFKQSFSI